jgi:alkylhydroperoxidase family enzyme
LSCRARRRTLSGMDNFTIHTPESAPEASREALDRLRTNVGFIPNLAATIAGSPTALQGFVAMQSSLRGSDLAPAEREIVGLTVSRENASPYSMAAHSTFAERVGLASEELAALRAGERLTDPRLESLHVFTAELLASRGHVSAEQLAELLAADYSPENVLEVVTQVVYTTMANLVANIAATPVDAAFEAHAWAAVSAHAS